MQKNKCLIYISDFQTIFELNLLVNNFNTLDCYIITDKLAIYEALIDKKIINVFVFNGKNIIVPEINKHKSNKNTKRILKFNSFLLLIKLVLNFFKALNRIRVWKKILVLNNFTSVLVFNDKVFFSEPLLIKAAKSLDINTYILPATTGEINVLHNFPWKHKMNQYHLGSGENSLFIGRFFYFFFPNLFFPYGNQFLTFNNLVDELLMTFFKLTPKSYFLTGLGCCDFVFCDGLLYKKLYQRYFGDMNKLILTGRPTFQYLEDKLKKDCNSHEIGRMSFLNLHKIKENKKLVLFQVPNLIDHGQVDKDEFSPILESIILQLKDLGMDYNVIVIFHPLSDPNNYLHLFDKSFIIVDEPIFEIIGFVDLYIGRPSTTFYFGLHLGIKCISLELFNINNNWFIENENVIKITKIDQIKSSIYNSFNLHFDKRFDSGYFSSKNSFSLIENALNS